MLDTCVIHVMARRVAGVSRSARLPILLAATGFQSAHNIYAQHCAATLDLALRAENSSIQRRLNAWTCAIYGIDSWETRVNLLTVPSDAMPPRLYRVPFYDLDMQEQWLVTVLGKVPSLPQNHRIASTYHTRAVEAETIPAIKETTYDYQQTTRWTEIGLQILAAAGWRPDCAVSEEENVEKRYHPPTMSTD